MLAGHADGLTGKVTLKGGETVAFSFSHSAEAPAVIPPLFRTPLSVLIAHTLFGGVLGAFYVVE
jgi:hypothetical protein